MGGSTFASVAQALGSRHTLTAQAAHATAVRATCGLRLHRQHWLRALALMSAPAAIINQPSQLSCHPGQPSSCSLVGHLFILVSGQS